MNRREILKMSAMVLGTTVSASLSQALMASVKPGTLPNVSLSADQSKNIAMLAEMFIPTIDTPGAIASGVPEFIETILTERYRDEERAILWMASPLSTTRHKPKKVWLTTRHLKNYAWGC